MLSITTSRANEFGLKVMTLVIYFFFANIYFAVLLTSYRTLRLVLFTKDLFTYLHVSYISCMVAYH